MTKNDENNLYISKPKKNIKKGHEDKLTKELSVAVSLEWLSEAKQKPRS